MYKIYSTTTCAYCVMVKKFFALKEREYEEVNLDHSPEQRDRIMELSGMTAVPVVTKVENGVEKLICVGWKPAILSKEL